MIDTPPVLTEPEWTARRTAHQGRVDAWVRPHLERRRRGERHPVADFLFSYYSLRPARLRRWHPGFGVTLDGAAALELLGLDGYRGYRRSGQGITLDLTELTARVPTIGWIRRLLSATLERPAHFGCFGLHEWAMVYRQPPEGVRHADWPLRLGVEETDQVVENSRIRCSHFDAFRFFTGPARPRNTLTPTREGQAELENPGCLHANMDLYKWAYKLSPLVPSELVADCFELTREIRELDMRASPYDLTAVGFSPVRIETAQGRAEYAAAQREFAERAEPLRRRLVSACDALAEALPG